jgi:fido (protein-threonine AMPylation protein)
VSELAECGKSGRVTVIGVIRPGKQRRPMLGDAGLGVSVAVHGFEPGYSRGSAVELTGQWDATQGLLMGASVVRACAAPDYVGLCDRLGRMCASAGLEDPLLQPPAVPAAQIDPFVEKARRARRVGEWITISDAAEILEAALESGRLSLDTLATVHGRVMGPSDPRAGHFRQSPVLIRWHGRVTHRPPDYLKARQALAAYFSGLASVVSGPRHPVDSAADAVAIITENHPFSDGNGRVARAVASWLLIRAGYAQRGRETLSTYLDALLEEHYAALRNYAASPWAWRQLFFDAVFEVFRPPERQ